MNRCRHQKIAAAEPLLKARVARFLTFNFGNYGDFGDFGNLLQSVTAPTLALETSLAYLARTPNWNLGEGGIQFARRRWSSSSETCRWRILFSASMVIWSPLLTSAIAPPTAASGATWPTTIP